MTAAVSYTPETWADALLKNLGLPVTPGNERAIVSWEKAEGGNWHNSATFNPLNTTQPEPGSHGTGTQGNIQAYTSWEQGLQGTVQTLTNGRYANILTQLRGGSNPQGVVNAVTASPWGTRSITLIPKGSGGGGFLSGVGSTISDGVKIGDSLVGDAANAVPGVGAAKDAANAVKNTSEAVVKVTETIFSLGFWIRVGFILLGFVLIIVGVKALVGGGSGSVLPTDTPSRPSPPTEKHVMTSTEKTPTGGTVKHVVTKEVPAT